MLSPEPKRPEADKNAKDRQAKAKDKGTQAKKDAGVSAIPGELGGASLPMKGSGSGQADTALNDREWQRLTGDLRAYKDAQAKSWNGIDETLLASYVLGTCSAAEKAKVEAALADKNGKVARCLQMIQDMLKIEGTEG